MALNDHGKGGHAVVFHFLVGEDMGDRSAAGHERVSDERAMAAPVKGLGAHDSSLEQAGKVPQLIEAAGELVGLHIIGEATKARAAPTFVGGFFTTTFPKPSQPREMNVSERRLGEIGSQRLAVELRCMPRPGAGSHIGEAGDLGRPEEAHQIFQASSRVSDGKEPTSWGFHPTLRMGRISWDMLQIALDYTSHRLGTPRAARSRPHLLNLNRLSAKLSNR